LSDGSSSAAAPDDDACGNSILSLLNKDAAMTASRIHLLAAALMGAAGVALWAYAAHRGGGGSSLVTAAQFLLVHAPAVMAFTACRKLGLANVLLLQFASAGLILGTSLFAGDIAARALLGGGLFPYAAPAGGMTLVVGWLLAMAAAVWPAGTRADRHGN
jgi:uncharacterized membrane protein YgdD (TMEM256/DUF423 family)